MLCVFSTHREGTMNSLENCIPCKAMDISSVTHEWWLVVPIENGTARHSAAMVMCTSHAAEAEENGHLVKLVK